LLPVHFLQNFSNITIPQKKHKIYKQNACKYGLLLRFNGFLMRNGFGLIYTFINKNENIDNM